MANSSSSSCSFLEDTHHQVKGVSFNFCFAGRFFKKINLGMGVEFCQMAFQHLVGQ